MPDELQPRSTRQPTGIWWPFPYAFRAIKQNPLVAVAAVILPLLAPFLLSGSLGLLANFCLTLIPILFLTISAMRSTAQDVAPDAQIESTIGLSMIGRMLVIGVCSTMFAGVLFTICSIGMFTPHPPVADKLPPQAGPPEFLDIVPTLVARHAIRKGSTIEESDLAIEDWDLSTGGPFERSDKPVIHNCKTVIGQVASEDIAAGAPITRFNVAFGASHKYYDPIPTQFDERVPHTYFPDPTTKHPLPYGDYIQELRSTQPIAKGWPLSALNVEKRYVPLKTIKFGVPTPYGKSNVNTITGSIANQDIPANTIINGRLIDPNPSNVTDEPPSYLKTQYDRVNAVMNAYGRSSKLLICPILGAIVWCFLYIRLCLTSAIICLEGTGLFRGAMRSWQLTRGSTTKIAMYLLPFTFLFWLLPNVASSSWSVVRLAWQVLNWIHRASPEQLVNIFGLLISGFSVPWGILCPMLFSIIVVPLYFRAKVREQETASAPRLPETSQPTILGCGQEHSKQKPEIGAADSTVISEDKSSVVLNIKKRVEETIE